MKRTSKLLALILALTMILSLATTAFATGETGTITVDNPQKDQTYTAYKIFDVTYNADKTAYSYTISGTSPWFSVVATVAEDGTVTSNIAGLTFEKAFSEDTYVVIKGDGFSAAAFANTLKANISGKTGTNLGLAADGKTASVTGLDLGYYFVTSTTGALCNLTTTNPSVTIHDKNEVLFDKIDDKENVEIGEIVNYTISGKVPDTTGFTTYKYQITDKMSEGLTFNNDVKVYINGTEITGNFTLTTGDAAGDKDFVLDIDVMNLTFGQTIEVKYSATVNENAAGKIEHNHATLEYSNDPTDSTKTTTRQDEETVYSAKIVIDKYASNPDNENDKSKKLSGAQFRLYRLVYPAPKPEPKSVDSKASEPIKMYYKYVAATATTPADVEWTTNPAEATVVTTDANGVADFKGLKDGTYYLEEVAAPAGYNLLKEPVEVNVKGTGDDNKTVVEANLTKTESVANKTGVELPSTGGMGTTIFYVVGSILLVGAAVLLITKKRMSAAQ